MGHKQSTVKVKAKITLHGSNILVDGLRLSYKRNSCFGGRRVVATFTFLKGGWQQVSEGILQNFSSKGVSVPLGKLHKKDGDTSVRITCLAGGVSVFQTQLALGDLLQRLRCTVRGSEALLFFSLAGGKMEGGKVHAFTTLFCNGKLCGEAPRVEAPHRPPAEGDENVDDSEGMDGSLGEDCHRLEEGPGVDDDEGAEDSPGLCGEGQGLGESPVVGENGEGMGDSPGLGGEGQGLEEIPSVGHDGLQQDVAPRQEEEATSYRSAPQEGAGRYSHYVATPTSYGSGGQGRGGLLNTLGICATVVVYMLMLYNAWLEWNKT